MEEILKTQKNIRFSVVGASNKNGAEERSVKMVGTMERTLFIHAALRYPEEKFSTAVWPMKMDYSVWLYNWIH